MAEAGKQNILVTLRSSGKKVLLREYRIKHREMAIRAVGNRAGESQFLFGELLQKELIKILLISVDEKALTPIQVEDVDSLFNPIEYNEVSKVLSKIVGGDTEAGEPKVEFVSSGA